MVQRPQVLDRYQSALQKELREILSQREGLLYQMMQYQFGWVDAQGQPVHYSYEPSLKATLCLLSCQALGASFEKALPAAAALDLIGSFIQVHADVQEGSPQREDKPSVWWVWGPGQAINVGDGLHALGRTALFRLEDRGVGAERIVKALSVLDEACIKMCEGQYLDLSYQERLDVSSTSYIKMAENKAGALMAGSMALGAVVASDDSGAVAAFQACGLKLGIAYQIREDILSLRKRHNSDLPSPEVLNKKKSFPIIQLMEKGDLKVKRELGSLYMKRVLEPSDMETIRNLLEKHNALDLAQSEAGKYYQEAMKSLDETDIEKAAREEIEELGRYIISRDR